MIRSGDILHNPATGETVRIVGSAGETGGEYVLVEVCVEPGGFVAATHVHPYQTEMFEILEGKLGFKAGGETIVAGPGETIVVEPGTAHRFWNAGDTSSRFRCEVRPALQFEQRLATMYGLPPTARRTARACRTRFGSPVAEQQFDDGLAGRGVVKDVSAANHRLSPCSVIRLWDRAIDARLPPARPRHSAESQRMRVR